MRARTGYPARRMASPTPRELPSPPVSCISLLARLLMRRRRIASLLVIPPTPASVDLMILLAFRLLVELLPMYFAGAVDGWTDCRRRDT